MSALVTVTVQPVIILIPTAATTSVLFTVIHQTDIKIGDSHSWNYPDSLSAPSLSSYEQTLGTDNQSNIYKWAEARQM